MAEIKPKVLICVDWFVPGYKAGGPIQSCKNLVLALHKEIDFYILTSNKDWGESKPYPDIQPNVWLKYNKTIPVLYASSDFLNFKNLREIIDEISPDHIYLNSLFSVRYTIFPLLLRFFRKINKNIILAPRGMLQHGALSIKSFKKRYYLSLFRFLKLSSLIDFHATVDIEANNIKRIFPGYKKLFTIGNFPAQENMPPIDIQKEPGKLRLVYASRISIEKNLLLLLRALKEKKYDGSIELSIAGQVKDEGYYNNCLQLSKEMPDNIKVKFVGPIDHSLLMYWLQSFHFFALPTLGENFGHAIYEALLGGLPVLISDRTIWRNLEEKKIGWDLPLDDLDLWIGSIERALSMGNEEFWEWSQNCRKFAQKYRESTALKNEYLELFRKAE